MIYIQSKQYDNAVEEVMNWLIHVYQKEVFRVGGSGKYEIQSLDILDEGIRVDLKNDFGETCSLAAVESVWLHGGNFNTDILDSLEDEILLKINWILCEDRKSIDYFILQSIKCLLPKCKIIGINGDDRHIKLQNLLFAQKAGFKIPKTYIVTKKERLNEIFESNNCSIVTKSIDASIYIETTKYLSMGHRTEPLTEQVISMLPYSFHPSLIQSNIEKLYELRIFFFKDRFYGMAIFSQNDPKTRVDFRNYNQDSPNRFVPYKIDSNLRDLLSSFIKLSGYDSGSLDLIVTPEKNYVFLEINPFGQFAFLADACNYSIERDIADYLANCSKY